MEGQSSANPTTRKMASGWYLPGTIIVVCIIAGLLLMMVSPWLSIVQLIGVAYALYLAVKTTVGAKKTHERVWAHWVSFALGVFSYIPIMIVATVFIGIYAFNTTDTGDSFVTTTSAPVAPDESISLPAEDHAIAIDGFYDYKAMDITSQFCRILGRSYATNSTAWLTKYYYGDPSTVDTSNPDIWMPGTFVQKNSKNTHLAEIPTYSGEGNVWCSIPMVDAFTTEQVLVGYYIQIDDNAPYFTWQTFVPGTPQGESYRTWLVASDNTNLPAGYPFSEATELNAEPPA